MPPASSSCGERIIFASRQHGIDNNVERCPHHFARDVDLDARRIRNPAISRAFGRGDHCRQEASNPFLTKNGSSSVTLPAPPRSVFEYVELVPNERLRYTDKFDDPNLPGDIQVTVTLKKVSVGTELNVVQEGLPDAIPTEACYLGWQESLRNLARLVEPEINQ
jgi:hypothetical protein